MNAMENNFLPYSEIDRSYQFISICICVNDYQEY